MLCRLMKFFLIGIILYRLVLNLGLVRTFFVPDEFWQSTDVAHEIIYRKNESLTWEWNKDNALRSPIYPYIIGYLVFYPLKLLNIDSAFLIRLGPRLFHSLLTIIGDFYFYNYCQIKYPKEQLHHLFLVYYSNWFLFYMSPRPLINNVELVFVLMTGYYHLKASQTMYKLLMIVSCLFRPTSIIYMATWLIKDLNSRNFFTKFKEYLFLTMIPLTVSVIFDSIFYQQWTMNQVNFFLFNFFTNGADFYGVHHKLWYLIEGIPSIMTISTIPLVFMIVLQAGRLETDLKMRFFIPLSCLSLIGHKEIRFILPLLPVMCEIVSRVNVPKETWKKYFLQLYTLCNIAMMVYFSLFHQIGPMSVVDLFDEWNNSGMKKIFLITPCHTIPPRSYLHSQHLDISSLSCEPNLSGQKDYVDEADLFFDNFKVSSKEMIAAYQPDCIVLFEKFTRELSNVLVLRGYQLERRIFHSLILTHSRHDNYINVWCRL